MADESENIDVHEADVVEGFLMKKGKRSAKLQRVYARVETEVARLKYGQLKECLTKHIELNGAVIKDLEEEKGKKNHFTIKPPNVNRTFHFATNSQDEHQKWLQSLCMARMAGKPKSHDSEACVVQ